MSAISYFTSPTRTKPPEFILTKDRIAIVVDPTRGEFDNPIVTRALYSKMVDILRTNNVNDRIVPFEEFIRLRQNNVDYSKWSIARIGKELRASQVIYIRIERLQLLERAEQPVVTPIAEGEVRVIDPNAPMTKARVWPGEMERREFKVTLPVVEASDEAAIDAEAAKLGRQTGRDIAEYFYEVNLEAPKERD